jgi:hypothetical protein
MPTSFLIAVNTSLAVFAAVDYRILDGDPANLSTAVGGAGEKVLLGSASSQGGAAFWHDSIQLVQFMAAKCHVVETKDRHFDRLI